MGPRFPIPDTEVEHRQRTCPLADVDPYEGRQVPVSSGPSWETGGESSWESITLPRNGRPGSPSYTTPTGYTGESFNIYDSARRVWHQSWVDNAGLLLQLDGGLVAGLQRPLDSIQSARKLRTAASTSRPSASYVTTSRSGLATKTITADLSLPREA